MFYNIQDLIEQSTNYSSLGELMIETEIKITGRSREEIIQLMENNLKIMKDSILEGLKGNPSVTGLTGGDGKKLHEQISRGTFLSGETILKAVRNGIAINEVNAQMGLICATPTAGSAGCVPGVLMAVTEKLGLSHQEQLEFLFAAGAFGLVIANNATISGAEGGCQAEVGSAAAMASAALVLANGGTVEEAAHALAITLNNTLGLICDPVAGLVEIPCIHRNALGASLAFISADMALAGIKSVIPPDEVIVCMYQVGRAMPSAFKETAQGGLAATPTGKKLMEDLFLSQP